MPTVDLDRLNRLANTTPGAISTEWGELWHPKNELGGAASEIAALRLALVAPPDPERLGIALGAMFCLLGPALLSLRYMPLVYCLLTWLCLGVLAAKVCYLVTPRNRLLSTGDGE